MPDLTRMDEEVISSHLFRSGRYMFLDICLSTAYMLRNAILIKFSSHRTMNIEQACYFPHHFGRLIR